MSGNRGIKNICVFLLMLVFSQKMGMGLYLHNCLHTSKQQHTATTNSTPGDEVKFACGCVDDFTVPFTELPALPQVPVLIPVVIAPVVAPIVSFQSIHKYFRSLRAPPAFIA